MPTRNFYARQMLRAVSRGCVLPRFAVCNFELRTESRDEHVVVNDQFGDGRRRQSNGDTDHAQ